MAGGLSSGNVPKNQMVDIHCHILPGVDDGAESLEESLAMLTKAAAAGVEVVVATPHLLRGSYEVDSLERQQMTADLQKAADENEIRIQIKPGVEYYIAPQILEDIDRLEEFTINNNGKYILVELPMRAIPPSMEDIFFSLKVKGITPVLAHPERNEKICRNPNILFDYVMKGCVTQINTGSILGHFGRDCRKTARELIIHHLAHIVASDMHTEASPTLDQAVPAVEKLAGEKQAALMFVENPRQIVAGEDFHQEETPQQIGSQHRGLRGLFSRSK